MNIFEFASTFIAIADQGSIQRAATYLYQTESAVSKKLKKLEEHLNVQLMIRSRSGLVLTDAGYLYYQLSKIAIEQFTQAETQVRQLKDDVRGVITIATNEYYFYKFVMPSLSIFLKKYPNIKLTFRLKEILPSFKNKSINLIIGSAKPSHDNVVMKKIDSTCYILCATPNYLLEHGTPNTPIELLKHNFIANATRNPPDKILFDNDEYILVKPIVYLHNATAMVESCLQGVGFIWVDKNFVQTYLDQNVLIQFMPNKTKKIWGIYVYYEYQTIPNLCIKAFMKFFFTEKNNLESLYPSL